MIEGYAETIAALTHPEVACVDLRTFSNVFVVGPTKAGKSSFCAALRRADAFSAAEHVQASGWIREAHPEAASMPDAERAAYLAARSLEALARNPDACVDWVRARMNRCGGGLLIDGLRNPRDFFSLFDPKTDYAVFVTRAGHAPLNAFEEGVVAIRAYAGWCEANLKAGRTATWDDTVFAADMTEVLQ